MKIDECSKCHKITEIVRGKWCRICKNNYEKIRRNGQSDEKKQEMRQKEKTRYENNKKKFHNTVFEFDNSIKKVCSVCEENMSIDNFYFAKQKGKFRSMCKICSKKKKREYYEKNKNKIIKKATLYQIERSKTDIKYKLERRMRDRLYHAFKSQSSIKRERTMKYIGCSKEFLKEWIEFQLNKCENMTFENYGVVWHIDHVKPCSSFDLDKEEEIYNCFSWKNLRPLLAIENLQKSKKILNTEIEIHSLLVNQFLEERDKNVKVGKASILEKKALL